MRAPLQRHSGKKETDQLRIQDFKAQGDQKALDEYIIGQDNAKKAISVAVYNHYKRIPPTQTKRAG